MTVPSDPETRAPGAVKFQGLLSRRRLRAFAKASTRLSSSPKSGRLSGSSSLAKAINRSRKLFAGPVAVSAMKGNNQGRFATSQTCVFSESLSHERDRASYLDRVVEK